MRRCTPRHQASVVCHALLACSAWAQLPDEAEQATAFACWREDRVLDFTSWTSPSSTLPRCIRSCPFGLDTVGKGPDKVDGDVPACVWRQRQTYGYRLSFGISMQCRQSECVFFNRWHVFYQMTSVKVAQLLGVPLSEVRSAFFYWVTPHWPEPAGSPKLQQFRIWRKDEVQANTTQGFLQRRRMGEADPWYIVYLAFRIDSARIDPWNRGVDLLSRNDTNGTKTHLGVAAEVIDFEMVESNVTAAEARAFPYSDFKSVLLFEDHVPNETPAQYAQREVGGDAGPFQDLGCLDRCRPVEELTNELGASRCANDCDCNGERWCSHFGECVGQTLACRSRDQTTTTASKGLEGGDAEQTTQPSSVPTTSTVTTTTESPLARLSEGCYGTIIEAWQSCTARHEAAGCGQLPCVVMGAVAQAQACQTDMCNMTSGSPGSIFLERWLGLCDDNATRTVFAARLQDCKAKDAPEARVEAVEEEVGSSIAGSIVVTLLWIFGAAFACCLSMVLAKVIIIRQHLLETRAYRRLRAGLQAVELWVRRRRSVVVVSGGKATPKGSPPATPPKGLSRSESGVSTKPPSTAGVSWSRASSPFRASPGSSKTESSPGFEARQAWTPEPEAAKFPWRPPRGRGAGRQAREDSKGRPAASSPEPASESASPSPAKKPRKAATKQQLLEIDSPKSLRKELQCQREATSLAERKRLFRDLVLRWHPDKNVGNEQHAAEMFQSLQECKEWFFSND